MRDEKYILEQIESRKQELFDMLIEMIAVDSQSFGNTSTGNEEAMARFLKDKFDQLNMDPDMYSPLEAGAESNVDYYSGRHLENRYNCAGFLPGKDHSKRIMLAAHEDTVIAGDPAEWSLDPFKAEIRNGRIYGRGACDDKYALAASLFLAKVFKDNDTLLPYDVVMVGYSDEENGGGNGAIAAGLRHKCDECISLDGHDMEIIAGGTGGGVVKCSIVYNAPSDSCAKMIDGLNIFRKEWELFGDRRKQEFLKIDYFNRTDIPNSTVRFTDIRSGFGGSAMGRVEVLVTFYTIHNEEDTRKEWSEMIDNMNEKLSAYNMQVDSFDMVTRFFHYVETEDNNKAMMLMSDLVGEMSNNSNIPVGMCLSDLPMFILHGSPKAFAFGCGRNFDQEGGAHQRDEFINCDDLVTYTKILAAFLMRYR